MLACKGCADKNFQVLHQGWSVAVLTAAEGVLCGVSVEHQPICPWELFLRASVPLEQSLGWFDLNSPYVRDWWLKLKILYLCTPWPWRIFEQEVLKAFINPAFLQSSVYVRWEFKEICYNLHHLVMLFLHVICISVVASYVCSTRPHSFALLSYVYLLACKHNFIWNL